MSATTDYRAIVGAAAVYLPNGQSDKPLTPLGTMPLPVDKGGRDEAGNFVPATAR